MRGILFLILVSITLQVKGQINKPFDYSKKWSKITIDIDTAEMTLEKNSNVIWVKTWDWKDTLSKVDGYYSIMRNINFENSKISKIEEDNIYIWSNNLVKNFNEPEVFCTCYKGKLTITIEYGPQIKKSCSYNSICDWRPLSIETKKLHGLLKRHFPKFE